MRFLVPDLKPFCFAVVYQLKNEKHTSWRSRTRAAGKRTRGGGGNRPSDQAESNHNRWCFFAPLSGLFVQSDQPISALNTPATRWLVTCVRSVATSFLHDLDIDLVQGNSVFPSAMTDFALRFPPFHFLQWASVNGAACGGPIHFLIPFTTQALSFCTSPLLHALLISALACTLLQFVKSDGEAHELKHVFYPEERNLYAATIQSVWEPNLRGLLTNRTLRLRIWCTNDERAQYLFFRVSGEESTCDDIADLCNVRQEAWNQRPFNPLSFKECSCIVHPEPHRNTSSWRSSVCIAFLIG